MPQTKTATSVLCEPAQSKSTYARIYRKKAGTQSEHPNQSPALTLTVRTLRCGHTAWGTKRGGSKAQKLGIYSTKASWLERCLRQHLWRKPQALEAKYIIVSCKRSPESIYWVDKHLKEVNVTIIRQRRGLTNQKWRPVVRLPLHPVCFLKATFIDYGNWN